jgi:hypothetical protein
MSERDIFREVEEDIRHEELARLWDRYGLFVLVSALVIVFGVAVGKGWTWWNAKQAAENGAMFAHASTLIEQGKTDDGVAELNKLLTNAPGGYRLLARLRLAAVDAAKGRGAEAVSAYDALADNATADPMFRGLARLQAATLRVDTADWNEMKQRLDQLNSPENPWRHSAKELLGLSAYRTGKTAEAQVLFGELLGDADAPGDLKKRAEMMQALLVQTGGSDRNTKEEPQSHENTKSQDGKTQDSKPQDAKTQ